MPKVIPREARIKIVVDWACGHDVDEITSKYDISPASLGNIISEARRGKFTELRDITPDIDGLRSLAKRIQSGNLSVEQAEAGWAVFDGLTDSGIQPSQYRECIELFRRLKPHEVPAHEFVSAALRLRHFEIESGMTFQQADAKLSELKSGIETAKAEKDSHLGEVKRLKAVEEDARQSLARTLKANNVTTELLERYGKDITTLEAVGITLNDINAAGELIRQARKQGFLRVVEELFQLEKATGKNHSELLDEYRQTLRLNEAAKEEANQSRQQAERLHGEVAKLRLEEASSLAEKNLTKERLDRYISILDSLKNCGCNFEHLEALYRVLDHLGRAGWQPSRVLEYLSQIADLRGQSRQAKTQLANVQVELDREETKLQTTRELTALAQTELKITLTAEAQAQQTLSDLEGQAAKEKLHIDLSDTFFLLLRNPAAVTPAQLMDFIATLQRVFEARFNSLAWGLPIDYRSLRAKLIALLLLLGRNQTEES